MHISVIFPSHISPCLALVFSASEVVFQMKSQCDGEMQSVANRGRLRLEGDEQTEEECGSGNNTRCQHGHMWRR